MRTAAAGAELASGMLTGVDRIHRRGPDSVIRPKLLEEGESR
jgi:hypothetical protein